MMREPGVVTGIDNGTAHIAMDAAGHAQCKSCGICRQAADGKTMTIDVAAPADLEVGERVVVEIPGPGPAASAVILLLLPLIAFIAGVFVSEFLRQKQIIHAGAWLSVLIGFALMAACYFAAALYDRRLRRQPGMVPRIVERGSLNPTIDDTEGH